MANGTTDYTLGGLHEAVKNMEKKMDILETIQKRQQSILDKGLGVLLFISIVGIGNLIAMFVNH